MPERLAVIEQWVRRDLKLPVEGIVPASSDASFRRYFRVHHNSETHIVMDAPPEREDCAQYVQIAEAMRACGLNVPEVLEADYGRGLLLISDLGSRMYLDVLGEDTVERLYGDALGALLALQACGPANQESWPPYDRVLLLSEMELFREWLLERQLDLRLRAGQHAILDDAFEWLAGCALEQPVVCVHRDYHSRNLMVTERHNPGILDFQDAVRGPVTYDLVSLLRDCYIRWPRARVEEWARGYHCLALQSGVLREDDEVQFMRWFDLMGVQRHLKAAGIFARLNQRDGKPGYLQDIPRTLRYVEEISSEYPELAGVHGLFVELGLQDAVSRVQG